MKIARTIMIGLFCLSFAVAAGCKGKQEAETKPAVPQQSPDGIKSITGEKAAGIQASDQDKADARAAAAKVIAQMEAGDFAAIYRDASPGFKNIGKEEAFVGKFQKTRQLIGPLGNGKEISFQTRPDQAHVLVYRFENAGFVTDRRFTFARARDGKMVLEGLNQHDEGKKK